MTREEIEARITEIGNLLASIAPGWAGLSRELSVIVGDLTARLVSQNDEQIRGRIKALRDVLELPQTLQHERDGLHAGLSEQSDPEQQQWIP